MTVVTISPPINNVEAPLVFPFYWYEPGEVEDPRIIVPEVRNGAKRELVAEGVGSNAIEDLILLTSEAVTNTIQVGANRHHPEREVTHNLFAVALGYPLVNPTTADINHVIGLVVDYDIGFHHDNAFEDPMLQGLEVDKEPDVQIHGYGIAAIMATYAIEYGYHNDIPGTKSVWYEVGAQRNAQEAAA